MRPAREVLLLPAAFFAAGIALSGRFPCTQTELLAGLAGLTGLWCVSGWARLQTARRFVTCATFLLLGVLAAEMQRPGRAPEMDAAPGETLLLAGCVVEPVIEGPEAVRFVIELEPGARVRITLVGDGLPALRYGQIVELHARVRKPRNFGNPGAFDYSGWLARQQIFWIANARGRENLRVMPGVCGSAVQRVAMGAREAVLRRVRELYPVGRTNARFSLPCWSARRL